VAHESWRGSSVEVGQLEGSAAQRVVCDENASGRDSRNTRLASISAMKLAGATPPASLRNWISAEQLRPPKALSPPHHHRTDVMMHRTRMPPMQPLKPPERNLGAGPPATFKSSSLRAIRHARPFY